MGDRIERVLAELEGLIAGDVRRDALTRAVYATDASIYEIVPDGVVRPKTVADVVAAVRVCGRHGVPLTPRGAGTGLTGGAVNRGIVLDCSRYLDRVVSIDPAARLARVEPGVVLDELNAALAPHGLYFPPDVATSSRATIGGMIANNSCGAHSLVIGSTVDHVAAVDVVLSDGSRHTWGADAAPRDNPLAQRCERALAAVAREYSADITARFPRVARGNGGYALDRLRGDDSRVNVETILCGSEGTLGVVSGATLRLLPLPRYQGMVVIHFDDLFPALAAVPTILEHRPAALELVDRLILDATRANPAMARRRWFLHDDPEAVLIVEMYAEDERRLTERLNELIAHLRSRSLGRAWPLITDRARQADVWAVRKAGLGLTMSRPGDAQPQAFVEDTAVDPARLHDYIRRFAQILAEEGVPQAGYYAHAGDGCLHVRPVLNLKRRDDVERLRRIAERVCALVLEFGGTITGEHGDGLVRSQWLAALYGPRLVEAFGRVKDAFDPHHTLNPGKIVQPPPMTSHLRYGEDYRSAAPPTVLDFSAYGGLAGLAEMCSGVGECRQRLVGTMCPSYMATGDELHTTRARANALRIALSNRGPLHGLDDAALDEVFDLCLGCKACRTECPTGTDVAKLKAEWLHARHQRRGAPRRARLLGRIADWSVWGSRLAPPSNWLAGSRAARVLMERWYGLHRAVPVPRFARPTFRRWFARRRAEATRSRPAVTRHATEAAHRWNSSLPLTVVYFVDTWTNYYLPQLGVATVKVLEALGCTVLAPPTVCCGRPLISQGLLAEARQLAQRNVSVLGPLAERGLPILCTEPSCLSVLLDELPQLVRTPAARRIAAAAQMVDSFVARALADRPGVLGFGPARRPLVYHGHCHQKALLGTGDSLALLRACTADGATEINSGCCGMAGAFGHEVEHYEVARAIGEQRLFPAIRTQSDAAVAVSGFSCRQHIEHHTGVAARHVIEYVADALVGRPDK